MAAAADLFYRQGYRATGINQVIAESGVAKASFYDHFPSKDDLLYAYLQQTARNELAEIRKLLDATPTARDRFFAPLRMLIPWFESSRYRGCPFQNILGEAPPDDPRVREVARNYHETIRTVIRGLTAELARAEKRLKNMSTLNIDEVTDTYLILLEGAIPLAVAYQDAWPVHHAIATLDARLKAG